MSKLPKLPNDGDSSSTLNDTELEYSKLLASIVSSGCGIDESGKSISPRDNSTRRTRIRCLDNYQKYKSNDSFTCDAAVLTLIYEFMELITSIYEAKESDYNGSSSTESAIELFDRIIALHHEFTFSPLYAPCLVELLTLVSS